MKQLEILIDEVQERQNYEIVKSSIFRDSPKKRREIIVAYLNGYQSSDYKTLKILANILREQDFSVNDVSELETEVKGIEEEIEVELFEKFLFLRSDQNLLDDIDNFDGYGFEAFLKTLFSKMGYQVEQTKLSGDQGADLTVIKFGEKMVIQAKRYGAKVGNYAVQEIMGAISLYKAQKGMVITNSYFTSAAIELATANNIELVDRDALEELINKHW